MKKIISMILSLSMILAIAATMGLSIAAAPEGTAIKSAADFAAMAADGKYYLDADITIEATYANEFTGTFDGNGKTVTVKAPMFAKVNGATISNFTVKGELDNTNGIAIGDYNFVSAVAVVACGASTLKGITSDVNFTATLDNGRYGAIAATSEADHALLIENCINNGNVTANLGKGNYAGGVFGWCDKKGNSTVKGCINNGDVTAYGYCGGVFARLAGSGEGGTINATNCVNNGNVTSTNSYAGGIFAYVNTPFINVIGCVNNGDITTADVAGGIVASVGAPGADGAYLFERNTNNGKVTSSAKKNIGGIVGTIADPKKAEISTFNWNINNGEVSKTTIGGGNAGGILGYQYGTGTAYSVFNGNVNTGTINCSHFCSQLLAYTNANGTAVTNSIAIGKINFVDPDKAAEGKALFIGLSSADITQYTVSGNYYIENDGTKGYSYADDDKNAKNRVALADTPAGAITFIAADKVADAVAAVNTALGSNIYEIKDGKIALVCEHTNYLQINGACAACGYTEPVVVPPVDEPSKPTGDSAWTYVVIAAVAVIGTAVVAKRREN